ncbi:MAG: DNRLRE domain-containing protein [Blastocatellia bacterium]
MQLPKKKTPSPRTSAPSRWIVFGVLFLAGLLALFASLRWGRLVKAAPRVAASTLQLSPSADNTLYEDATGSISNAIGQRLYVGNTAQAEGSKRRAVLKFNLSTIPAGATITSATLSLNMSKTLNTTGQTIAVHRLLKNWGEGTSNGATGPPGSGEGNGNTATTGDATWLHTFYNTQLWSAPGGDFAATPSTSALVNAPGRAQWTGAGLVADVEQWRSNAATNFGWLLLGDEAKVETVMQFDSKDHLNPANRPVLTIEYTVGPSLDTLNVQANAGKAGSVLVFPYYISRLQTRADTSLSLSNIGSQIVEAHLFFIDGTSCNSFDQFICLTPNASLAFDASEFDPETRGWLLAVAVDDQGRPTQNNALIGSAFVTDGEYVGNYGAEAFRANSATPATISNNNATLNFDGVGYDAVPSQFVAEIKSPLDATGQRIVTVGLSGDLKQKTLSGAAQVGSGQIFHGNETPFSNFSNFLLGACQASATFSATSPRVQPAMSQLLPTKQVGTVKLNVGAAVGLLMTPRVAKWGGIRALHKTAVTTATLTIPIVVPTC